MSSEGGGWRWCPQRRKCFPCVVSLLVLLILPLLSHSNVSKDFEQAPQNDNIEELLEEEALISMNRNVSIKQIEDFPRSQRADNGVETFTSLNKKYEHHVNLLSEDAMMSDFLPSEYNLLQERMKREIIEGSGGVNECEELNVCNEPNELCIDRDNGYECTCVDGYERRDQQCFPEMFVNGVQQGDQVMFRVDDGSVFVDVEDGIPFRSTLYYRVWISTNGVISFGTRFSGIFPRLPAFGANILCPYWADIDLRSFISRSKDAGIFYHVYDSRDTSMLNQVSSFFQRYASISFQPTWTLVVTYRDTAQARFPSSTETATFQVILANNDYYTHVLYIYNKLAWTPRRDIPIYIGYQSSNIRDERLVSLPMSNSIAAYTYSGLGSNTNFPGVYKFIDIGGRITSYATKCRNWYYNWLTDYRNRLRAFNRLPWCACNGFMMFWDRRFYFSDFIWLINGGFEICFTTRFRRRFFPLSRECCYRNGFWLRRNSGRAWRFHPRWRPVQHIQADLEGREYCCQRSNGCFRYNRIRPRGGCYFRFPFFFAWAFGDPHITTLDGRTYIFNGFGEYIMVEVDEDDEKFVLQARTEQALNKDGDLTKATVFTAFAATDYTDRFNVELSGDKTRLVIYRNGNDLTSDFHLDANYTFTDSVNGGLSVSRENDSVVGVFDAGITVRVGLGPKLLTISVGMPEALRGKTKGLMGNNNGDKTDDFIEPDGTKLPDTSTEAQLYEYGQKWQIDPAKSYLMYPPRKNASDFAHPDFVPLYLDQASTQERADALAACDNDETNLPCIFDFLATKDQELATATKVTDKTAGEERLEQSNTAPVLTSSKTDDSDQTVLQVTVGETTTFALNATDNDSGDTIKYQIIDKPDSGFRIEEENQSGSERKATITWTPENANATKISVAAQDSKNASSDPIEVEIVLCDKCSNHGQCDFTKTRTDANTAADEDFQLAACDCYTGWTGDDCSVDYNGCAENPCFEGQNCTDLTPEEEVSFNRTFNCSECPDGYTIEEEKCTDIDECNTTSVCQQQCNNVQGSYTCTCFQGYRLVNAVCQDINECVEGLHDCEQICTNNEGGFTCSCVDTYYLDETDNKACIENTTASNPCQALNCSYGCRTEGSGVECFCQSGYELNPDQETCNDTDECKQNVCGQECENTVGSYKCSCLAGYKLADDKLACDECTDLTYGLNCQERCDCGDRFSRCDNVLGCICNNGWRGAKCEIDVDECTENPNSCAAGTVCENTDGSFQCNCPSGYEKADDDTCKDINECLTDANTCSQECNNVPGSFFCSCRTGYTASGVNCSDIDECETDKSGCSQDCVNQEGSFNCECQFGYRLQNDRKTCEQVENVCAEVKNLNCSQGCSVREETEEAFCFCNIGYRLGTDQQTCLDIDECTSADKKCTHTCTNTDGGFTCSCPVGFKLDNDKVTCQVCDDQHWGVECAEDCGCGIGSVRCDSVTGCQCKVGWLGAKCDQDKNECQDTSISCPTNSDCVNNPGSYRCVCRTGFQLNSTTNTCDDIDECAPDLNTCDQKCDNSFGSFICSCNDGFSRINDKCENVNECQTGGNDCQQLCRDTVGGYACSCRPGFSLSITDRRSCVAETTCQTLLNCSQQCQVDNGMESCFCNNSFFKLSSDNITCIDVNECTEGTDPCAAGGATCTNKPDGQGFQCACIDGYKLQDDGVSCRECEAGKYGDNCNNDCSCEPANTKECIKYNGTCVCLQGWEGNDCTNDTNECLIKEITLSCGNNAQCINTNGSYICECSDGYFRTGDKCQQCDNKHWGKNCANNCTCNAINSLSCNPVNSTCTCKEGWKLPTCDSDVNECTDNTTICDGIPNSICSNSDGSFTCKCKDGYTKDLTTGDCVDVNECLDPTINDCLQECENVIGSRVCSCSVGYTGTGNDCNDIDECAVNATLCSGTPDSTCKNKNGTFDCECNSGYSQNATTLQCEDDDECVNTAICDKEVNTVCVNTIGSYNCTCKMGYSYNATTDMCEDDDECKVDASLCSGTADSTCKNTPGAYECDCNMGYEKNTDTDKCDDINECETTPTICDAQVNTECENLKGTSHCVCKIGFLLNTTSNECEDINECNENHGCDFKCVNFDNGTFTCICDTGFVLNLDGKTCDATKTIFSEIRLDTVFIENTNTVAYSTLKASILNMLINYFRGIFGDAFVRVVLYGIRRGSVVANYSTTINSKVQSNPEGTFIKAVSNLANTNVTLGGQVTLVEGVTVGGKNVSADLCDVFNTLQDCGSTAVCNADSGTPVCKAFPVTTTKTIFSEIRLDTEFIENTNTVAYSTLKANILNMLINYFRGIFGDAFVRVVLYGIRRGSVVANYSTTINSKVQSNPEGTFIKAVSNLANTNVTLGGRVTLVEGVTVGGKNVSADLCDAFNTLQDCGSTAVCNADSGTPVCKAFPVTSDQRLIIGLSIGIPLFVITVGIIIAILIIRSRRSRRYKERSDEGNGDAFTRPFASQLATRGGFYSINRGMYSPDSLSAASSDSDRRKKKNGRSSFRDSAWYSREERPDRMYENENDASNFSWDFLYRIMPPNETFEIRRPQVSVTDTPLRSTRKNRFSNA